MAAKATASPATATWPSSSTGRHRPPARSSQPSQPHADTARTRPGLHAAAARAAHRRRQFLHRRRPGHPPDRRRPGACRSSTAARCSRPTARMTGKRLAALIGLRDLARRVLQSQNEGWPEADRERRPPGAEPGLRPLRRRLRPDQQDHLQRNRRRHASSAACPTSSNSAKTRTPCWSWRWKITTR